jgi:NAD(P)-dependent dehydrogenase (short-subunit alcohol dehydrogenase family)
MTQPTISRAALVTGGSSGIGLAVARILIDDGFGVTICARTAERLAEAEAELASHGDVHAVVADVADEIAVDRLIQSHQERFDRLDLLVNNAGSVTIGTVSTGGVAPLDDQLASNVRPAWMVTAASTPLLKKAGAEHGQATVVTVSSILGRYGQAIMAAYSTSKAALFALTQAIHDELAASGVRATTVAPAYVATPMTEPLAHLDRDGMIRPEDVAETVRYLARLGRTCVVPEIHLLRPVDRLLATRASPPRDAAAASDRRGWPP